MRKNQNTNRGITLIALIITIIVLLILAGVALATLTGDSGILSNADKAKENTIKANIKEQVQLAVQTALIESLGKEISEENLQEELDKIFGEGKASINYDASKKEYTVIVDEYEVSVTNKGNTGEPEKADILIKLALSVDNKTLNAEELPNVKEVTSENVPIPEGFYRVGGTKDTGLVISDVEGDDLNNTAQGNQFVWVPVNQNQKLTLEVTSNEEITGITIIGADGAETKPVASGKTHSQEIEMTKNGVYTVKVETASGIKTVRKTIRSLYAQDTEMIMPQVLEFYLSSISESNKYETAEQFEEDKGTSIEDLAKENNCSIGMYMYQSNVYIEELEEDLKEVGRQLISLAYQDRNQNAPSVEKYGGFYIARFEAGDGDAEAVRTASSSDENTLVSKKGAYVYNYIACEDSTETGDAMRLASGMKTNSYVTSQLITGAGWDRTMNWLIETGMEEEKLIIDSRSWGNYDNSTENAETNSGSSNMNYTTGRSEYWKVNNIYDLAGNTWEWTQEQYDIGGLGPDSILRGGDYGTYGGIRPAACRYNDFYRPEAQYGNISFRTQLYIK